MKNNYISQLHFISKHLFTLLILVLLVFGGGSVSATTYYSVADGNWNTPGTWSKNDRGTPLTTGFPVVGDVVTITRGWTVTVNITNAACTSLQLGTVAGGSGQTGALTFSGSGSPALTVSGSVTVGGTANNGSNGTITFTSGSSMTAGNLQLGGSSSATNGTLNMTSGGTLTLKGAFTIGAGTGTKTFTPGTGTVILNATNTLPANTFTTFNNLTCSAGTTTMGVGLTINGNLSILGGATFNTSNYGLTVTGTTTVGSGTLTIGANGTKIFKGLVLVNSGGTWKNSGNSPITFQGGITNNGTFTSGNGTQTFDTNPQNLNGNIDLSGAATSFNTNVTNQGTLTLTANVSGSGALINASTGTLNLAAYTTVTTLTNQGTLNASGNNNISPTTLTNTSTGILNLSGAAYTAPTTFTNQGILTYTSSANINTPVTNTGTINVQSSGYIAGITNNAVGTVNISALSYNINTLTATTAGNTVNYNGMGDQTVNNVTYSNLILSGSGTKTFTAATTINNNFTINTGAVANLNNILTHKANAYYLDGVLQYPGSWGGAGSTANNITTNFSASTGLLNATTGMTCNVSSNSISYSTGIISATAAENANAVLTAPTGAAFTKVEFASFGSPSGTAPNFVQGACHAATSQSVCEAALLGNNTATIAATIGNFGDPCFGTVKSLYVSATYAMPVCSGSNPGIITGSTPTGGTGTYTYIWESSTTNATSGFATITGATSKDYTPTAISQTTWYRRTVNSGCGNTSTIVQITVSQPNVGGTAVAAVGAINSGGTTTITVTGYTGTIQWQQSANGSTGWATVTGGSGGTTATYTTAGLTTTTYYRAALTNNTCPTAYSSTATVTVIQCAGTWTGATSTDWNKASNWCNNVIPTATTDVVIPSGVTNYPTIGSLGGLCNNITINSGASLTQKPDSASNLFVSGNWANNGTYSSGKGTVTFSGTSAQTIGGGISTSFYNLTLQNTGGVTLNKPTTVTRAILLITGNLNTTLSNLLTVTNTANSGIMGGSSLSYINGPINWYLPANLTSAVTYIFPVGNTSYLPYSLVNPITGTSPTAQVQAFNANPYGTYSSPLTAVSTTEYWKLTTAGTFTSTTVSLGKGDMTIYPNNVIAQSSTSNGNYSSLGGTTGFYDVSNSDRTNNVNYFFALGTTATPTINISPALLGGFGYVFNFGPSSEQTLIVNGTSLPADITITSPPEFEISLTTGIGFVQSIILPKNGSSMVDNVKLYIRLKAGLAVGTYNDKPITMVSSTTTRTVMCSGTVFATTPSILTSGGLNCAGDKIELGSSSNDINILYWTGPNNYYSQLAGPTINAPITSSMYGTYTVTGSLPTGANLVTNGTFEAGNVGFLSSYSYINVTADGTNNTNEGIYAIIDIPHWLHSGFSTSVDSPDAGTKQMVINGATIANVTVWSETVKVVPNSTYQFSYWLQSVVDGNPSIIQLYANNQPIGTPFTAVQAVGNYRKYYYNWDSGSSTSVTLDLRNQNTAQGGNDFALDNIDFRTVTQVSSSVNVTSNPAAAVTISTPTLNVATKIATGTTGTSTIFTATPTNGGTAPTYVWTVTNKANIVVSYPSTSSSTFNYVPSDGDVIKCVMTSNSSCIKTDPKDATSNLITMAVAGTKNYWLGAVGAGGTVWSNPANWTIKVPASGDDVEFASTVVGSYGTAAKNDLYLDYNRVVGNLINNASGRNLIIVADKELVVNNKIIQAAVADITKKYDQIQIKADNTGILPSGSLIFYNLRKEPVYATIELYSKAYKEDTAIVVNGVPYSYNWQLFGIPLTSVAANPTFYDSYVRQYQENKSGLYTKWNQLDNSSVLYPFKGYEITQLAPKTLTFQGTLVNNDTTILLPVTAKNTVPIVYFRGQHILSNPYAAAIDAREIVYDVANTESTVYLYNTGSFAKWYNNGGSTTYDETSTTAGQYIALPKAAAGSNGVPFDIPSMSGFLVKATDTLVVSPAATSPGSIQIKYSSVIVKNVHPLRVKKSESVSSTDLISTKIDLIGLHYSDRMWIFTEPSCTKNFDNGWDGRKILGSSLAPQLYAVEPDGDYQVNSVADMHNTDIAFQPGDEVEYTLKFTHENIKQKYAGVYLQDLVENKTVDVTESGTTYKFATAPASEPSKRFKIITRYYEKDAPDTESSIKIFSARATVFIQNLSTNSGECTLYDVLGRTVAKKIYGPNSVTEIDNLTQGAYVTTAITNGEKVSKRIIVQ